MRAAPPLCLLAALAGCNLPDPDLRPAPPRRAAFGEGILVSNTAGAVRAICGDWNLVVEEPWGVRLFVNDVIGGRTGERWPREIRGVSDPSLSGNDWMLAFVAAETPPAVYAVTGRDPSERRLVSTPGTAAGRPAVDPAGERVAWVEGAAGGARIWVTTLSDGRATFVADGRDPAWSRDGLWIAFESGSPPSIFKVRPDGSDLTRLTENRDARRPVWSPDSRWIAFGQFDADGRADDIWAVSADGSRFLRVTWDPAPEWDPCWAPDRRIFFTTVRNGAQGIWVVAPENSELLK